ncbi:MAG: twin-arginine translocation signal domain-containing protein [Chloroflexi bacterium]|nr:twin-arginine translocation signal domain-containing protein [Chloroflexota bacterium]
MIRKHHLQSSKRKPSRRDFLKMSGIGMAAAMMARYGLAPAFGQGMADIPAELLPGSPNNPRG